MEPPEYLAKQKMFLSRGRNGLLQFGQLGNTVADLTRRCVKAEGGNTAKNRLIDALREELSDLCQQLAQERRHCPISF